MSKKPSIDAAPGWPLEEIGNEALKGVATDLGFGAKNATMLACAKRLATPQFLQKVLGTRTNFQLVTLEALLDMGAVADEETLWEEACRRIGQPNRPFEEDGVAFASGSLGCSLQARHSNTRLVALFTPCVEPLRQLLSGASLPQLHSPLPEPAQQAWVDSRNLIIIAARTGQRTVRETKAGSPSRSHRRRFDKDTSAETPNTIWSLLESVSASDLTTIDSAGVIMPNIPVIEAYAQGQRCLEDPPLETEVAALLRQGPTSLEAIFRAGVRDMFSHAAKANGQIALVRSWALVENRSKLLRLRNLPGVWIGKVDGIEVIAAPLPDKDGQGHVLPNFDVMLGPETSLPVVATVALAAELVRLDRLVTFRITPASVRSAVAHGVKVSTILAAFDKVGQRPTPSNVRQSVQEWAQDLKTAKIVRDRVVVLPQAAALQVLAAAKTKSAFQSLAPGILRVADSVTEHQLRVHLEAVGVLVEPESELNADAHDPAGPGTPAADSFSTQPQHHDLDPTVVGRLTKALATSDFPDAFSSLTGPHASDNHGEDDEAIPAEALEELRAVTREVEQDLRDWHRELAPRAQKKVDLEHLINISPVVPLLTMVQEGARARILRRSTKAGHLLDRAKRALNAGKLALNPAGPRAHPQEADFPDMRPREIRSLLERYARSKAEIYLRLQRGSRAAPSQKFVVDTLTPRGADIAVHLLGCATDEAHAYPLTSISSLIDAEQWESPPAELMELLQAMTMHGPTDPF